ncbi:hypothetical protein WMY93_000612 [Mugilogobius chulae]|uniref:Uncharacterized protein n=1 Tax=Mugilogobius chulae TaxID=88201 RepID=A0AAW0QEQ1_9GOBI
MKLLFSELLQLQASAYALSHLLSGDQLGTLNRRRSRGGDRPGPVCDPHERRSHLQRLLPGRRPPDVLRVIAHSSMQRVLRNRHELLNSSQDAVFIFWGPSSYMRRDGKGLIYNNLRLMSQLLPKLKVYIISWQKMQQFDEIFKKETGKDR